MQLLSETNPGLLAIISYKELDSASKSITDPEIAALLSQIVSNKRESEAKAKLIQESLTKSQEGMRYASQEPADLPKKNSLPIDGFTPTAKITVVMDESQVSKLKRIPSKEGQKLCK